MEEEFLFNYGYTKDYLNACLQNYKYNRNDNPLYKSLNSTLYKNEYLRNYSDISFSYYNLRNKLKQFISENKLEISNKGRVFLNGKVLNQFQKNYGYLYVSLSKDLDYPVYRLVAETWCKCPVKDTCDHPPYNYWEVHHIQNNGFNNTATNLIWMISTDHRKLLHKNEINNIRLSLLEKLKQNDLSIEEQYEFLDDLIAINNKNDIPLINDFCSSNKIHINEPYYFWNYHNIK